MSISYGNGGLVYGSYHSPDTYCPKCNQWNLLLGRVTEDRGPHLECTQCGAFFHMPRIELQEMVTCEQR